MSIKLTSPSALTAALVARCWPRPRPCRHSPPTTCRRQAPPWCSRASTTAKFTGNFPGFTTTLSFDPAKLAKPKLDVSIPLAGTNTGNGDRDSTLSGEDFFNVAKFAQARYTATKFRSLGGNQYAADGTLTCAE